MTPYLPTLIAAALLLLSFIHESPAGVFRHETLSVRIDGYVGSKPEEVPIEVSWIVSVKGEMYDLHVGKLVVLTGDVAYYDIITALQPYRPALTVIGSDEEIDRFATAPTNQKISVTGFLQFAGGARYLMISNVDYPAEPEQTPTVTTDEQAPNAFP